MASLSIVIPCYYNEANIPDTTQALLELEKIFPDGTTLEYVFVDDGSKDKTYEKLTYFQQKYPDRVTIVKLSGNFGSHSALLAGLHYATGDCIAFLAADLQDPPELLARMFEHWQKGIKLVLAHRTDRPERGLSRFLAQSFHYMIRQYALKQAPHGGFDLVLFDKQLRHDLLNIKEKNTHLYYLLLWLRYEYVSIPYVRRVREKGVSRWTFAKKIKLWIDSFTAFSYAPIRLITVSGFVLGGGAMLYAMVIIVMRLLGWVSITGWSAMMVVLLVVSSFQMVALGILGEYLWRVLDAVRNRPPYVVEEVRKRKGERSNDPIG